MTESVKVLSVCKHCWNPNIMQSNGLQSQISAWTTKHGSNPTHHNLQASTNTQSLTYLLLLPKGSNNILSVPKTLWSDKIPWAGGNLLCSYNPRPETCDAGWCRQSLYPVSPCRQLLLFSNEQRKASMERLVTKSQEFSLNMWWLDPQSKSQAKRLIECPCLWVELPQGLSSRILCPAPLHFIRKGNQENQHVYLSPFQESKQESKLQEAPFGLK